MECNNCSIKKICTIYKMKKEYEHEVSFDVKTCNFKNVKDLKSIQTDGQAVESVNAFADSFDEQEYNRLLNKINNVKTIEFNNEIVECNSCHGKDYITEIKTCNVCGKEICGNCGTSDMGMNYCSECWERL